MGESIPQPKLRTRGEAYFQILAGDDSQVLAELHEALRRLVAIRGYVSVGNTLVDQDITSMVETGRWAAQVEYPQ